MGLQRGVTGVVESAQGAVVFHERVPARKKKNRSRSDGGEAMVGEAPAPRH